MMKRFSCLLIICFLGIPISGQNLSEKHHIEFSVGEPLSTLWGVNLAYYGHTKGQSYFYEWADSRRPFIDLGRSGYEDSWFTPSFSLGYYYQILPWLEIGGELSTLLSCTTENNFSDHRAYAYFLTSNLHISTGARFVYYHKKITDLYSGLALGLSCRFYTTETTPLLGSSFWLTWQVTALGVRFGKQVYGNIELGYGYKGLLSAGIGYRF